MIKALAAGIAGLALFAGSANAATVFQSTFQGATFTLTQNSDTSATFDIDGVDALSGDWDNAVSLSAFAFKGLGLTSATATLAGGGSPVPSVSNELNANGCAGGGSGSVCFTFSPISIAGKTSLSFDLAAVNGTFDIDTPHLKVLWLDAKGKKAGDLYSQDIPVFTSSVPEPATWAMMITGFGLAGVALRRRRNAFASA